MPGRHGIPQRGSQTANSGFAGAVEEVAESVEKALRSVLDGLGNGAWYVVTDRKRRLGERAAWRIINGQGGSLRVALRGSGSGPVMVVEDNYGRSLEINLPDTPLATFFATIYVLTPYILEPRGLAMEKDAAELMRGSSGGLSDTLQAIASLYTPVPRDWYRKASRILTSLALVEGLTDCANCRNCVRRLLSARNYWRRLLRVVAVEDTTVAIAIVPRTASGNGPAGDDTGYSQAYYILEYDAESDKAVIWTPHGQLAEIYDASRVAAETLRKYLHMVLCYVLGSSQGGTGKSAPCSPEEVRKALSSSPGAGIPVLPELEVIDHIGLADGIPGAYPARLALLQRAEKRWEKHGVVVCFDCYTFRYLHRYRREVKKEMKNLLASLLPLAVTVFGGGDTAYRVVELAHGILNGAEPPSPENVTGSVDAMEKLEPLYRRVKKVSDSVKESPDEYTPSPGDVIAALAYALAVEYLARPGWKGSRGDGPVLEKVLENPNADSWSGVAALILFASSVHPMTVAKYSKHRGNGEDTKPYWFHVARVLDYIREPLELSEETGSVLVTAILVARLLSLDSLWAAMSEDFLARAVGLQGKIAVAWGDDGVKEVDQGGGAGSTRSPAAASLDSLARLIALVETGKPEYLFAEAKLFMPDENRPWLQGVEITVETGEKRVRYRYVIREGRIGPLPGYDSGAVEDTAGGAMDIRLLKPFDKNTRSLSGLLFGRALVPVLLSIPVPWFLDDAVGNLKRYMHAITPLIDRDVLQENGGEQGIDRLLILPSLDESSGRVEAGAVSLEEGVISLMIDAKRKRDNLYIEEPRWKFEAYLESSAIDREIVEYTMTVVAGCPEDCDGYSPASIALYRWLRPFTLGVAETVELAFHAGRTGVGDNDERASSGPSMFVRFRAGDVYNRDTLLSIIKKLRERVREIADEGSVPASGEPSSPDSYWVLGLLVLPRHGPFTAHRVYRIRSPVDNDRAIQLAKALAEAEESVRKLLTSSHTYCEEDMEEGGIEKCYERIEEEQEISGGLAARTVLKLAMPLGDYPRLPSRPETAGHQIRMLRYTGGRDGPPIIMAQFSYNYAVSALDALAGVDATSPVYSGDEYGIVFTLSMHPASIYLLEKVYGGGGKLFEDADVIRERVAQAARRALEEAARAARRRAGRWEIVFAL